MVKFRGGAGAYVYMYIYIYIYMCIYIYYMLHIFMYIYAGAVVYTYLRAHTWSNLGMIGIRSVLSVCACTDTHIHVSMYMPIARHVSNQQEASMRM